jgi:cytochrome d ubiquinol oxidase subunit II
MGPEWAIAALILVVLAVYALTGGADFGGGLWDLFAVGRRARAQREAIARAIGPIWEANHVWLIVVLVLLWTCFPRVFAVVGTALHVPLAVTLLGIVLRGTAFVFRHYDRQDASSHFGWSLIFAVGSIVTPVSFGICIGAISSGALRIDPATGRVVTDFVSSWAAPFPGVVGLYTLALFAWLAATYMTNEVGYAPLRDDFRQRALGAGVLAGVLAFGVLAWMPTGAPPLWLAATRSPWVIGFVAAVSALALAALGSTWFRWYRWARALAAATVVGVVGGWGVAMVPVLVQPDLTLQNAAAPAVVLWTTIAVFGAGSVVLVPSFLWLFHIFRTGAFGAAIEPHAHGAAAPSGDSGGISGSSRHR